MPIQPLPCGSGAGDGGADVEQVLLCDVLPDGSIAGTALAVYEYDETGAPTGAPTFVDPATGLPYVAQGVLQPCPGDIGCAAPVQFCFTGTTSGPVEHPGRMYDIALPINPGFAVDSLQIDATSYPANLVWAVTDADGAQFATGLQAFLAARFPGETVTVTNPNAGTPVCGQAIPMTAHIECARIDAPAPNLVELVYNGGRDLVVNPAYLTTPPTNLNGPQFVYMQRQDAGGTLNCTSVANRGWETNDGVGGADFELWGQGPGGLQTQEAATPTPRGTPIQEITADFPAGSNPPTIWQTFTVPAAGTLKAVLVHGARDNGEQHRITLSTGDTDDNQIGDIVNNVTNPPAVTNSGGGIPGPWTTFSQDVALGVGLYTFAISTTNPVGANRGGLFTDMRVYIDAPAQHAAAVTDDDTCTITTDETVTTTTCEYWQPRCTNGEITAWVNVADGQELDNAAFWGQAPAPSCCLPEAGDGGGGSVSAGNLIHNYEVCGVLNGTPTTLQRVVISDQSGGMVGQTFIGPDGGPVTPTSYVVGPCGGATPVVGEFILCDDNGPFVRKLIQSAQGIVTAVVNVTLAGVPYVPVGTVQVCDTACRNSAAVLLCDAPADDITTVSPTITDGTPGDVGQGQFQALPGAYTPLWTGGTLPFPATAGPGQQHAMAVGQLLASPAGCDDAAGNLNVSVRVTQTGPGTGQAWDGALRVFRGTTLLADDPVRTYAPPGWVQTLTASVPVTAADLAAGDIRVGLALETFHGTAKGWNADQFSATVDLAGCDATSAVQFFRTVVTDCETGAVVSTTDTDLEGAPYVVTGEVGQCTTIVQPSGSNADTEVLALCDSGPVTPVPFLRRLTFDETGVLTSTVDTDLDGTPYLVSGDAVVCDAGTPGRDVEQAVLCDDSGPFIRVYQYGDDSGTPTGTPSDYTLAGAPYVPVGAVGACDDCCPVVLSTELCATGDRRVTSLRLADGTVLLVDNSDGTAVLPADIIECPNGCVTASSIGTVCYTPPVAVQTLQDDWAGTTSTVGGGSRVWTNSNFGGAGFTVTETVTPDTGAALLGTGVRNTATSPATQHTVIDLGAPRNNVTVRMDFFGSAQGERLRNISPAVSAVSGNATSVLAGTGADAGPAADGTAFLLFPGPVQVISWDYAPTGGGLSGQTNISFNSGNASNSAEAAVLRNCDTGVTTFVDLATGTVLNPAAISIVDCPGDTAPETDPAETLTAQARLLTNAAPWTPGADVAGVLTGLSFTVLTGTATLVDSNGTVSAALPTGVTLDWQVEDANTLSPPTSMTPAAGGSVLAVWTQR